MLLPKPGGQIKLDVYKTKRGEKKKEIPLWCLGENPFQSLVWVKQAGVSPLSSQPN